MKKQTHKKTHLANEFTYPFFNFSISQQPSRSKTEPSHYILYKKTLETEKRRTRTRELHSLTFILERSTGDSRNDVGLSPGGIVTHGALEIGSFAGDISLYLAPTVMPEFAAAAAADSGRDPSRFGLSGSNSA